MKRTGKIIKIDRSKNSGFKMQEEQSKPSCLVGEEEELTEDEKKFIALIARTYVDFIINYNNPSSNAA